jgi:hypothetical protein
MYAEAQSHESLLKRWHPELGRGLPLFTSCLEEVFSETQLATAFFCGAVD